MNDTVMDGEINDKLQKLQLSEKSAISLGKLESDYVLDFAVQRGSNEEILAATSSNYNIRLYSRKDLANIGCIKGHTDVVSGVAFGETEPSLLYSSSQDGTVRCWDLRMGLDEETQTFKGPDSANVKLTCVDVDCTDRLLCSGTEETEDNAYILFWDRRKGDILGCYAESHQRDITQVSFHPTNKEHLASACDDGLVCIFDVSQTSEDDALLFTFNAECSVSCIGWYGQLGKSIYSITSIDTFHVWDIIEGDEQKKVENIKQKLEDTSSPIDYIVDMLTPQEDGKDLLVAGTYGGDVRLVEVYDSEVSVVKSLETGHRDRIRCSHWSKQNNSLVTGGEDSLLCLWSAEPVTTSHGRDSVKGKVKVKRKGKKSRPY